MTRLHTLVLAVLVGSSLSWAPRCAAQAEDATPPEIRTGVGRFEFEETVLNNGLRVISLEDASTPICALQLWYHVGSKDEQIDRQGFAHMFEHMMFRGTERLGVKEHFDYIRRTGGGCNAYTAFDQTVYVQEFPSNQLEMVMWLESERMAALKIDEGGFATERKVVEEERRLGLNQPYGDVLEQALDFLFDQHPYRWSPIGKIEHLRASSPDDIQRFWDTYYVPNNATLVVVGDVKHGQVRSLAQRYFGWIPRCPEPPRVTTTEPEQTELRSIGIKPSNGPVPIAALVFRTVPEGHEDALPLQMLMSILGGGESSRVYIDLVRRKEIAVAGMGLYGGLEQAGFAILAGVTMPFGDLDEVLDALWEQTDKIKKDGVTPKELEKVRNQMARSNVTESLTVASKASALGQAAVILGDAQLVNTYLARVAEVTGDDLKRVANTYLVTERANEFRIEPGLMSMLSTMLSGVGGSESDAANETGDEEETEGGRQAVAKGPKAQAKPPEGYPASPPMAPPLGIEIDIAADEVMLDNGLKLVVVENHEVPFISVSLRLRVGGYTEESEHPGTASMALQMLTRGTVAHDAEALAAELEEHAITLTASANTDSASVRASALTSEFDRAVRLLAEVVQAPDFDAKEFKTLRDQTVTGLTIAEKTPSVIADRTLNQALWGDHPYGRPSSGTADDVLQLDVERLHEWWFDYARPEQATVYVAGDVDMERARKTVDRFLGSWESEGDPIPVQLPAWTPPKKTTIRLVDRPGSIQSEIRVAHEGITRRHQHYATSVVLNQVFGGAFSSRLMESLRVEKGLTYGASGGLHAYRFGGDFSARTFTKTQTTAETVRALIDEVARMRTDPPTDEELSDAVSYLAGSFPGSLETPQAMANRLWTLQLNDLPSDWWKDYLKRITSTTQEDVAAVAKDLLDPERLIVVVVGDAKAVREDLEEIARVKVITEGG